LTRIELKSLTQLSECAGTESGCLRMLSECLGISSMRLGVPFIAPRQLGAVEDNMEGYSCLLSSGAPDSPVRHRTATVACLVPISFLFWHRRPLQLQARWRTGQSGAPCRPLVWATHRPWIARPTAALTTVGSPDSPVHHQTVR
jgi:hypothetical protein